MPQGGGWILALPHARRAVFLANDGIAGTELWRTDGTTLGTVLHQDLSPGPYGGEPSQPVLAGTRLWFAANGGGGQGSELWSMPSMAAAVPRGMGCAGTGGRVPALRGVGAPVVNNQGFGLAVSQAHQNTGTVLFLGLGPDYFPVANDCFFYLNRLILFFGGSTDGQGNGVIGLPIPNDPTLSGSAFYSQLAIVDPAGPVLGALTLSNSVKCVVSAR
jgi:ELWxxDGT repeat protein